MANWYTQDMADYFQAVLRLNSEEECLAFFSDICTVTELQAISQRLRVARLLRNGFSYSSITAETGVSAATISRVSHCLEYGTGGYDLVLNRLKQEGEDR
ncbi:MAG: TrpR YerC/YecD [Oscillospiraceae bacterium]|nr:TrpR YerC/YecD [Oscillospiraceae bacterium]